LHKVGLKVNASNADFYYSGERKTEEGSYWIEENEPFPF